MTRFLRLFLRDTSGVAAAELALMLPLLALLLFGGMELSNLMWAEHQVVKSVRNGARFAARQAPSNFTCGASNLGAADTQVRNLIRTGSLDGQGDPVVRKWTDGSASTIAISVECDTASAYSTGGIYRDASGTGAPAIPSAMRVKIDVTVPYPALFGTFSLGSYNLRAEGQSPVTGF